MKRILAGAAALAALLAGSDAVASTLPSISNSIPYRDSSKPHATGRAGGAEVEALALLGKDRSTELIVTTNGNLEKVQLTLAGSTQNFNGLSGATFTQSLDGLDRFAPLQVQANVSGADGPRTGVVTLTESVKLRPDLLIDSVSSEPHGVAGAPVNVIAVIREHNGDLGARANCVLSADGIDVDRANGIWVDANGSVACHLAHAFENTGTRQLQVRVEGVTPGDYDDTNNSASATVRIYDDTSDFVLWSAAATSGQWSSTSKLQAWYREEESSSGGWSTTMNFNARLPWPINFEALRVSYDAASDGVTLDHVDDAQLVGSDSPCKSDWRDGLTISVCKRPPLRSSPNRNPIVTIDIGRAGGEVTYRSHGWYSQYGNPNDPNDRYTFNYDTTTNSGPAIPLGNTVALTVRASDGTRLWEAQPFINLAPYASHTDNPWSCNVIWDGSTVCSSYSYHATGRNGVASAAPPPND